VSTAAAVDGVRTDSKLRIRESAHFFESGSNRLFAFRHAPLGEPVALALVCPSIYADFTLSYRREVVLARSLAARGVIVQRFHYRGSGNSDGDAAGVMYDALVEDAHAAAQLLAEQAPGLPLALVGMGWGAIVAATVSRPLPGAPLAVWQPVADISRYYKEAVRARMIRHVVEPKGRPASAEQLLAELATEGSIDVLGYPVHRALYETAGPRTLPGELGYGARRMLLIQPDGRDALRTDYAQLAASCAAQGAEVETITIGKPTPIWFHGPHVRLSDDAARKVAANISSWLGPGSKT
jgi:alpha/beta superfamily hydrolase